MYYCDKMEAKIQKVGKEEEKSDCDSEKNIYDCYSCEHRYKCFVELFETIEAFEGEKMKKEDE